MFLEEILLDSWAKVWFKPFQAEIFSLPGLKLCLEVGENVDQGVVRRKGSVQMKGKVVKWETGVEVLNTNEVKLFPPEDPGEIVFAKNMVEKLLSVRKILDRSISNLHDRQGPKLNPQ